MDITALKLKYNALLEREKLGEAYLDNEQIPEEKRDKALPRFQSICMELSVLLNQIGPHTTEESINGFRITEMEGK